MWRLQPQTSSILKSILFCGTFTALLALASFLKGLLPGEYERWAYGAIGCGVVMLVVAVFLRFEQKKPKDIGLQWNNRSIPKFFFGVAIGVAISAAMISVQVGSSVLYLEWLGTQQTMFFLWWSLVLLPLALMEEVAFRSYPFYTLKEAVGIRMTQVVMAILFALYHVAGGQSVFSSFSGPGVWAFVFGAGLLISGGISLPTGLHVGANVVLAAIGQHRGIDPIFNIQSTTDITPEAQQSIDNVGFVLQMVLLAMAIVVTEWWSRKAKKTTF